MKEKEIFRIATFAWSPTSSLPFIATGTVAGALDESFSNESQLEIWQPNFMDRDESCLGVDPGSKPVGFVTDTSRFNRITWGQAYKDRSRGIIAAGMENGDLALWDPAKIVSHVDASESLILRNTIHTGPVRGLDFNPVQGNLLSSGAVSGEVYIWDLNDPSRPYSPTPGNRSSKLDEITSVAWNRQVQYVLAGASSSGYSVVWDLRGKREVAALAYGGGAGTLGGAVGSGMAVGGRRGMSALAWHPDNATRLVTASEDDMSPVIMVWDLRNARAPEKILTGHEKGILSLSWCNQDADLLLSCGKDNRVLCWNPQTSEIIGELPSAENWAFQVEWCPRNPDLLAAAFFSGTIGIHSLQSTNAISPSVQATPRPSGAELYDSPLPSLPSDRAFHGLNLSLKQPPRWLRCPVSASFGFGGKLVTVSNLFSAHGKTQSSVVHMRRVVSETDIVARLNKLRTAEVEGKLEGFTRGSAGEQSCAQETWKALSSLFKSNSREELITLLGYSKEVVKARIEEASAKLKSARLQRNRNLYNVPALSYTVDDELDQLEPRDPVVSFVDPEPDPEVDVTDTEKTGSELSTSDVLPADGESTTTVPSLFGDDVGVGPFGAGTGADFFSTMAAQDADGNDTRTLVIPHTNYPIDSSVAATIGSGPSSVASESLSVKNNTFRIYSSDESEIDRLVTRALVVGDFSSAVELCLSAERFSDALLLAIKGGDDLFQRTQKAYFENRTAERPYLRLFQSIVTDDLEDIVQNADLTEWAEVFVVLCTFASGEEFGAMAEQLGARLEFQAGVLRTEGAESSEDGNLSDVLDIRRTAMLTYLAAGRLERLVNIWIEELAEEARDRTEGLDSDETTSFYGAHAHALQTFIEKVTVFRGAAKYVDRDMSSTESAGGAIKAYKLAALYDKYVEYAEMLAAQGLVQEAIEYLKLTPERYKGSELRERLSGLSGQVSSISNSVRDAAPNEVTVQPSVGYHPPVPVSMQGRPYVPTQSYSPAPSQHYGTPHNPYAPVQTLVKPPSLGGPPAQPPIRPPVSSIPPPSAQNGWKDAPPVKGAGRRSTPSSISTTKPEPILSPFPNATQSPPTPGSPFSSHGLHPPPRPASVQSRPPPPPQGRSPQSLRSVPPPGQPPVSPPPHAANGAQHMSPSFRSVPLGSTAGSYARATPPLGPPRSGTAPPSSSFVPAPPPPGVVLGPYAPPPTSQVGPLAQQPHGSYAPQTLQRPGHYGPPPPQAPGPYAPPPNQVSMQAGPYGPPPPAASVGQGLPPMGPPQTQHHHGHGHGHTHSHGHRHEPPPPSGPSGQAQAPSARVAAPPRGPPPPKYPPGDRSHIPESAMPIYTVLTEQLGCLKQTAPKRMVEDLERRINVLFDALNCETLSKSVVDQLSVLVRAMSAQDREAALSLHVDLLTRGSQTDDIGLWMSGIRQLILRL